MRGTLGGTFGTLVGVALDITNRIYKARTEADKAEVKVKEVPPTAAFAPPEAPPPTAFFPPTALLSTQAGPPQPMPEKVAPHLAKPKPPKAVIPPPPVAEEGAAGVGGMGAAAAVAVVGAVVAAVVIGFKAIVGEANQMVTKYEEYSPEIAQAQAMAEVRKITGDMRRAQESGGELAEFIKAQSEMQEHWEDLKTKIMTKIIPVVTGILEVLGALFGLASKRDTDEELKDPTTVLLGGEVAVPDFINQR